MQKEIQKYSLKEYEIKKDFLKKAEKLTATLPQGLFLKIGKKEILNLLKTNIKVNYSLIILQQINSVKNF